MLRGNIRWVSNDVETHQESFDEHTQSYFTIGFYIRRLPCNKHSNNKQNKVEKQRHIEPLNVDANKQRIQIWLYENVNNRIEGYIVGKCSVDVCRVCNAYTCARVQASTST